MKKAFTVGYGNRDFEQFVNLLKENLIEVVCDVRSSPYSKRFGNFNRETLQISLQSFLIKYVFLGDSLGARPSDPEMYINGRASYEMIEKSSNYAQGIERLELGIEK